MTFVDVFGRRRVFPVFNLKYTYDMKVFKSDFGPQISLINNSKLWKCVFQKNSWSLAVQKLLFPLEKCPRDSERIKKKVGWRNVTSVKVAR